MTVKINIDNRTIIRILVVVVIFMLGLSALEALRTPLSIVGIAFFFALALNPPVTYLADRLPRGSRALATAIAYLIVISLIGLFLYATVPALVRETSRFLDNVPEYVDRIRNEENVVSDFIERYELDDEIEDFGNDLASRIGDASGPIFTGIGRVGVGLVSVLTVLVLTFLMLIEGPQILKKFWSYQPPDKRKHRQELALRMYHVVTGYVNGQLLLALGSGFFSLIAMLVLGVPFALPLAGLVGVFGLIPLIGATLASVIVVIVALFESVFAAVAMAIFFLVYQQIENNVFQPYVQSRTLEISPLLVLIAVIFGFSLGGILGGFIAIPVAAMLRILFLDYLEQRQAREEKTKKRRRPRVKKISG